MKKLRLETSGDRAQAIKLFNFMYSSGFAAGYRAAILDDDKARKECSESVWERAKKERLYDLSDTQLENLLFMLGTLGEADIMKEPQ